ncbi:MAG: DUF1464 family protein [Gemmataceae bacterium]|nr:DUF1464 family protein [Gemmataceae bacterium]
MPRVAGTDPGTSSLDLLILEDGAVGEQCRFTPEELQADPNAPARWLLERGPFDLVAGPSGYGLPLTTGRACGERELALMALVRPDDRGRGQGVLKFSAVVRSLCAAPLPVVFLPGAIHLPTIPAHRKANRIDLGTADKVCVAAVALATEAGRHPGRHASCDFCLVELGSAFTACLVVRGGRIVDAVGGTSGPLGWGSGGAWDGEAAYLLGALAKSDLFAGGAGTYPDAAEGRAAFRESLLKTVAGLRAATSFGRILLSGRLLEMEPVLARGVAADLEALGEVAVLPSLPGAWVKHAAQGAALLADGLAGGTHAALVDGLGIRTAAGTALDWLRQPRAGEVRRAFGLDL